MHSLEVSNINLCLYNAVDKKYCKWNCTHQKGDKDIYALYDLKSLPQNWFVYIRIFTNNLKKEYQANSNQVHIYPTIETRISDCRPTIANSDLYCCRI